MKVMFVCTANTCRSPMAEGLFRKMLKEKGIDGVEVTSGGIFAVGEARSKHTVRVLSDLECNNIEDLSRAVMPEDMAECDRIYCMTEEHRNCLVEAFPQYTDKVEVLGDGIFDPFNGSLDLYRQCRDDILRALAKVLEWVEANV